MIFVLSFSGSPVAQLWAGTPAVYEKDVTEEMAAEIAKRVTQNFVSCHVCFPQDLSEFGRHDCFGWDVYLCVGGRRG